LERWKNWKIENEEWMKKWEDIKDFSFPYLCLDRGMEKWRDENLFCLIEKKIKMIENVVYMNLLLYPYLYIL